MTRAPSRAYKAPSKKILARYKRKFGRHCKIKFRYSKPPRVVRPEARLIAVDSLGNKHFATYYKNKFGLWKFTSSTPILEFLRYCSPVDARKALAKRHLSYSWSSQCHQSANQAAS